MTFAPQRIIQDSLPQTLIVFDLRLPGSAESLHSQRAAWQDRSDIEALDKDHFVLIVRTGGAVVGTEERGVHGE